jgi:hypothetical protein
MGTCSLDVLPHLTEKDFRLSVCYGTFYFQEMKAKVCSHVAQTYDTPVRIVREFTEENLSEDWVRVFNKKICVL